MVRSSAKQNWWKRPTARRASCRCSILLVVAGLLAATPAHAVKTLRVALEQDVNGLDPQVANDSYSGWVCRSIFDPLLEYDYLKRPYELRPATARALPEIRDGGTTIVVRIKPGIHFTPDPVFKGRPRELVAADYVYSWKRLIDPRMRSFWSFYLDGKLVGADELVAAAKASGRFDYDAKLEGLQALDRYTLQIKLKQPDYMLLEFMTTRVMAAVAREVVEAYGSPENGWTMDHPVGTGPFKLKEWRRGSKIVLARNPDYRDDRFPETVDASEPLSVRANAGRRLPLVDQVEVSIIEEANPRLLAFDAGQLDYLPVPYSLVDKVQDGGKLRPDYARKGVQSARVLESAFTYTYFQMDDPVVGGYTAEKVALRRAITMAYDVGDEIRVLRKGQAVPATQMIPPGLIGHDPARRRIVYDPAAAQALLDRFGYKRGADGWRARPDGSPLVLKLGSPPSRLLFAPSLDMGPYMSCAVIGRLHGMFYSCEQRFIDGAPASDDSVRMARIYKALSDEQRLRILDILREREMYAQEIVDRTGLGQSMVSRHLGFLRAVGLLRVRRVSNMKFFSLNPDIRRQLSKTLDLFPETVPAEGGH